MCAYSDPSLRCSRRASAVSLSRLALRHMRGPTTERVRVQFAGRVVDLYLSQLGLACCGLEVSEARRMTLGLVANQPSTDPDLSPALSVLVVAGTVTTALAPLLVQSFADLPEPRAVLAFGACAATGGPYWDSYSVIPGAHHVVPVNVWVAGCPPRPADLLAGLEEVINACP